MNESEFFDLSTLAFDVSEIHFIQVVLVGVFAFVALWVIRRLLWFFLKRRSQRELLQRTYPFIVTVFWSAYALWSIDLIFVHDSMRVVATVLLLIVLVAGFAWYAARDFMAGIVLKSQSNYELGRMISVGDQRGTIRSRGNLALELEGMDGRRWRMPWSTLSTTIHARENPTATVHRHSFQLTVASGTRLPVFEARVRSLIKQTPWTILRQDPRVEIETETAESFVFLVTVFIIAPSYGTDVERAVRNALTNENFLQSGGGKPLELKP